jgi:hypothetical protein
MPKSTKDLAYSEQHVFERASERYGLQLSAEDYTRLNDVVRRGDSAAPSATISTSPTDGADGGASANDSSTNDAEGAAALLNEEGDEQIWAVSWAGHTLVCVWNKALGRVTTLLPEGTVVTRRKGAGTKQRKGKKR